MSGIAGIIHWDDRPVDERELRHMMELVRHRGPQGLNWECRQHIGLGHAVLALKDGETGQQQPIWLPDQSCAIVADARLYNRKDLLRRLGDIPWRRFNVSDAAVILAAYERWGQALLDIVDGDFVFAIWDAVKGKVLAARDPFGVKPFFYWSGGSAFLFGSEPKQLLTLPGVFQGLDDVTVGEYLFDKFEELERTFFRDIRRLKPGHFLIASPKETRQNRYWNPDPERELSCGKTEYFESFREVFTTAVAKRLETDYSVGAQLSGGMDSPSVVLTAAEIQRNHRQAFPHLETISATFEDLPCDETRYIRTVTQRIPFQSHSVCPLSDALLEGIEDDFWQTDSPMANIQRGMFNVWARWAQSRRIKVLLTGYGGDELIHPDPYLQDLAIRREFPRLILDSWRGSRTSYKSFLWLLADGLRAALPGGVKRAYRRVRPERKWQAPDWARPDFVAFWSSLPGVSQVPAVRFGSLTQAEALESVSHPTLCWFLELFELEGSYYGFEPRHPFLDRTLVEFVLATPFELRKSNGDWKYLLYRGLGSLLPAEILRRKRKTVFDSYENYVFSKARQQLEHHLFNPATWESHHYVVRERAEEAIKRYVIQPNKSFGLGSIWAVSTVELWLRRMERYTVHRFENRIRRIA